MGRMMQTPSLAVINEKESPRVDDARFIVEIGFKKRAKTSTGSW